MKNLRKKKTEINFIEIWKNYYKQKNMKNGSPVIILCAFFEIFDIIENTSHSRCIEKLYLHGGINTYFEKVAQELNVDISTLRRYRSKYIKVISYITDCDKTSQTFKLLQLMSNT